MGKKTFAIISVVALVLAVYLLFFSGLMPNKTRIVLVSSDEMIMKDICSDFNEENKDIKLVYRMKADYEADDYVDSGRADMWIPNEIGYVCYAEQDYSYQKPGKELYGRFTKIAFTPMMFVSARDRYAYTSQMSLQDIYNNVVEKKGWDEISGDLGRGSFRFQCPDPYSDEYGADFISLFIHDYYRTIGETKKALKLSDLDDLDLQNYIKPFISGISLEGYYESSFLYRFDNDEEPEIDMCAAYEWSFFQDNSKDDWRNVRIHYPEQTISMPLNIISMEDSVADPKKNEAIKRFEEYMLREDVQQKLITLGYRPVNATEATLSSLEEKYGSYGIKAELPELIDALDYKIIEDFKYTMGKYVPAVID